jgi:hypothetical protein
MLKHLFLLIMFTLFVLSANAYAQRRQGPCDQYTNPEAKRHCLQQQADEANRQAKVAAENLRRANERMNIACNAVSILDQAARVGRRLPDGRIQLGSRTWSSIRDLTSQLTRERQNCESAKREVERARK